MKTIDTTSGRMPRWLATVAAATLSGAATAGVGGGILYVDADAPHGGDGQGWETACRSVQDALAAAEESGGRITEIRIAEGVYRPDHGETQITGNRSASFRLRNGLAIRGGYAGLGAREPDVRDPGRFPTVLSGDLDGDDEAGFVGIGDNSYHVVRGVDVNRTAVLDGVRVSGGNANGDVPDERGAGLLLESSGPMILDVVFEANAATTGGGIYVGGGIPDLFSVTVQDNIAALGGGVFLADAAPAMSDCVFERNHAVVGGGLYGDNSDATITGGLFRDNAADVNGGGVFNVDGDPTLAGCRFLLNRANFDGGGFYTIAGHPSLLDCSFLSNCAADGGGLHVVAGNPMLADCRFVGNEATNGGGGVNLSSGAAAFVSCIFNENHALRGGGVFIDRGEPTLTGCRWNGNDADDDGGAVFVENGCPGFDRCDFLDNSAGRRGAGLAVIGGGPTLSDSNFTRNVVSGGFVSSGGAIHVSGGGGAALVRCVVSTCEAKFGGGVSIENGSADLVECTLRENVAIAGGGLYLSMGAALLTDCLIEGNLAVGSALAQGGGVHAREGDPVLIRCTVRANAAEVSGGGVYAENAGVTLASCSFEGNLAHGFGGGLYSRGGDPRLERCVFAGNSSVNGGGLFNLLGNALVVQCLFTGNMARGMVNDDGCTNGGLGGGVQSIGGLSTFTGCTFSANSVGCNGSGGGLSGVRGVLQNCVLWGNVDGGGTDESAQIDGGAPDLQFSCVQGLTGDLGGDGNIGFDPLFVDAIGADGVVGTLDDDLRLAAGSPCIDAGNNYVVTEKTRFDLAGNPRFVDDPAVRDSGVGDPPLVDLGVYERPAVACPADFDGDRVVGFTDLLGLLFAWGVCPGCPPDLDGSGTVDFIDLLLLLDAWGACG